MAATSWASNAAALDRETLRGQTGGEPRQGLGITAIDDHMGACAGQRPRPWPNPDGHGCPKQRQFLPSSRKRSCAIAAPEKAQYPSCQRLVNKSLRHHRPAPLELCCGATLWYVQPYWKQRFATVKLQIRSTIGTPNRASSVADRRITKGQVSMTSKYLLAHPDGGPLLGAATGGAWAQPKAMPPSLRQSPRVCARALGRGPDREQRQGLSDGPGRDRRRETRFPTARPTTI